MNQLFVSLVLAATLSFSTVATAGDYPQPTQSQLRWGGCTWRVANQYNKTALYFRVAFNGANIEIKDYETWEDFDISIATDACGDMPGIWSTPAGLSYEVLRQTTPKR